MALILECPVRVDHTLYRQTVAVAMGITEQDLAEGMNKHRGVEEEHEASPSAQARPRCNTKVECAWTNRLVGLTCRILNYCFDTRPRSIQEWSSLLIELETWGVEKPDTFQPYFETDPDPGNGQPFPKVYLQNDWHGEWNVNVASQALRIRRWKPQTAYTDCRQPVLGLLYYHMSMVLLKSNQPRRGCMGKDLRTVEYNTRVRKCLFYLSITHVVLL